MTPPTDNGGPAFPLECEWNKEKSENNGMTLRDYFAAAALTGMLAHPETEVEPSPERLEALMREGPWAIADAMLAARKATND